MERKMRRFKQMLPAEEAKNILHQATNGILSLIDRDGEPYGVPLSFAYDGTDTLYFHSARAGHKIECMSANNRASFCIIAKDEIVPKEFTSYFQSVIANGKLEIATDTAEILKGLRLLCDKYSPGLDASAEINKCLEHVLVFKLQIETLTGKEAIDLTRNRWEEDAIRLQAERQDDFS